MDPRTQAVTALSRIIQNQASLSSALPALIEPLADRDRGLMRELSYGTLRYYPQLRAYIKLLLHKPLKARDSDIEATLLIGLYQILHTRIPDHAAIGATVEVTRHLNKPWAAGLVNGVLRRFLRERQTLAEKLNGGKAGFSDGGEFRFAHPKWLIRAIHRAWPDQAETILEANNTHPPFTIRLNRGHLDRQQYRRLLSNNNIESMETPFSEAGLTLTAAVDVKQLPGFSRGLLSVQDEAAQLAAPLLRLAPGQRVLDACCAPGGKTGHILETVDTLEQLTAVDIEPGRLTRVEENLRRLGLLEENNSGPVKLICADALEPERWWNGQPFERILLDAPCSATGVIRRHPDIKLLRNRLDIAKLARLQEKLLLSLWPLLAPEGLLVYATCSIMPEENTRVVEAFIASRADAVHEPIAADWGMTQPCGRQLFPRIGGHDGFYYACIRKHGPVYANVGPCAQARRLSDNKNA